MRNIDIFKSIIVYGVNRYTIDSFCIISNRNGIILLKTNGISCSIIITCIFCYVCTILRCNRCNLISFLIVWCTRCYRHYPVFPGIDMNLFVRFNRNIFTSFFRAYGTRFTVCWKFFFNRNKIILLISHCYLLSVFHLDCNHTIGTIIKHSVIFSDVHTVFSIYFRTKEIKMSAIYRKSLMFRNISISDCSRCTVNWSSLCIHVLYPVGGRCFSLCIDFLYGFL